jgi:hypothetical protein
MELNLQQPETTQENLSIYLLPTETWTDVFGFLSRPKLAKLVPHISNWHFAKKAQFFLHECGKFTIGNLLILIRWPVNKPGPITRKVMIFRDFCELIFPECRGLPLPADMPMPENITNFTGIYFRFTNLT